MAWNQFICLELSCDRCRDAVEFLDELPVQLANNCREARTRCSPGFDCGFAIDSRFYADRTFGRDCYNRYSLGTNPAGTRWSKAAWTRRSVSEQCPTAADGLDAFCW